METIKVTGMVSRYTNYNEYDRIITIISENGRFDAIARGVRRQNGRLCSAAQLFNYGEFVLSKRRDKLAVSQFAMHQSFFELSGDYKKFQAASQCASIVTDTISSKHSEELFYLMYYVMSVLCFGDCEAEDTLICFAIKALSIHGFTPYSTTCALCGASTYSKGRFHDFYGAMCASCGAKKGGKEIEPISLLAIKKIIDLDIKNLNDVKLPENIRAVLIDMISRYYKRHMEKELIFL